MKKYIAIIFYNFDSEIVKEICNTHSDAIRTLKELFDEEVKVCTEESESDISTTIHSDEDMEINYGGSVHGFERDDIAFYRIVEIEIDI